MVTDTEIRAAIAAERTDLADMLDGLPRARWDEPSLCAGWRVREVVAHLTMPFRYSTPRFLLELAKSGGRFNAMSDRRARQDAATLSVDELASAMRDNAHHPWKPPGGGFVGALTHDVLHGLDITIALGLDRTVPADRMLIVLGGFEVGKALRFFGVDLRGIELHADDLDWTLGAGTPMSGAGQDLALAMVGRRLPTGRLRGEPSGRFTAE
jgi:uncharacterized protein (TIGR03083 family)